MEANVVTANSARLQSALLLRKPWAPLRYSTVNEQLNIRTSDTPNQGEYPVMNIAVIGNGGLKTTTGSDGVSFVQSYTHRPDDTGLFKPMPFLVRPTNADIGELTRTKYRFRKIVSDVNGQGSYYAYYGRVVDLSQADPKLYLHNVQPNGTVGATELAEFTNDNLNPTPQNLLVGQPVTTDGKYISSSAKIPFVLDATDVNEILNASQLLYGNINHSVISEIGLVAGIDRSIDAQAGGTAILFTESVCAQICSYLAALFPTPQYANGVTWTFDFGYSLPLYTNTNA